MPKMKYYCHKCEREHFHSSKLGKKHQKYWSNKPKNIKRITFSGIDFEEEEEIDPNYLLMDKLEAKWKRNKSQRERTIKKQVYDYPAKLIGKDVFVLADVFLIEEWGSLKELLEALEDRYQHRKDLDKDLKYRFYKRKNHVEVWRTY